MATASTTTDKKIACRRMQNFMLIWVDENINSDAEKTLEKLRSIINDTSLVRTTSDCIDLVKRMTDEKYFVISSGSIGKELVPKIHSMTNFEAIYLYDENKTMYEEWTKEWIKIKGFYTKFDSIYQILKLAVKQCNQDSVAISFIDIDDENSTSDLNHLEPSFMYTRMLKNTILTMKHRPKQDLIEFVEIAIKQYATKSIDRYALEEFGRTYRSEQAILWYTKETFVYHIVNNALRQFEGDIIVDMGFFINDLHRQLKILHEKQRRKYHSELITLYRGQGLAENDITKLKRRIGGLMGFNCFLSTSEKRETSAAFATYGATKPGMMGVLFVMRIDPKLTGIPFANIKEYSELPEEDEILFSTHTIFRINNVQAVPENARLFEVELVLTGDDDPQLKRLANFLEEQIKGKGWHRLASILKDMNYLEKAEEIYSELLENNSDEYDRGTYYHQLGSIKNRQGLYREALINYGKALVMKKKVLPPDDPSLATTYNCIGSVHDNLGEYQKALINYERALAIRKKILQRMHPSLAQSYNNMGLVYDHMGMYSEALANYEQALEIKKKTLPETHPSLATLYNNMGVAYNNMGEYSKALQNHEKALEIRKRILPNTHPDFALSLNNMALVYQSMKDYSKALQLFERSLTIWQSALVPMHPNITKVLASIELVKRII